jgi:hypothetical protein
MTIFIVATCNYVRYGRGGGQEIKNAICILSLNIINDKVRFGEGCWLHIINDKARFGEG